jgi:hypothetical protein
MNVQQRPKVIDDSFGGGFPLPHNIEAEQCVLGAILINNEAFAYVNRLIDAEDFFEPINQYIFGICRNLICERKLANPITIKNFLPHDLTILNMTASQYVARLAAEATTVINAPDYAKVIRDLAIRRHIIVAAEDCALAAKTAAVDVPSEAIAEDTIKRISEITSFRGGTGSNEAAPQIRPLTAAEFLQLELKQRSSMISATKSARMRSIGACPVVVERFTRLRFMYGKRHRTWDTRRLGARPILGNSGVTSHAGAGYGSVWRQHIVHRGSLGTRNTRRYRLWNRGTRARSEARVGRRQAPARKHSDQPHALGSHPRYPVF